jgi:branched-chain amino acid transport system ATP-binding protein
VLDLRSVSAGYGKLTIIRDLDLQVPVGTALGVFGRNGAGKSTLVNSIVGLVQISAGRVLWEGQDLTRRRTDQIVKAGICLVPQSRGLFMTQTVLENLSLVRFTLRLSRRVMAERLEDIFTRFPQLANRRRSFAASLSGGEQQMLAIAKALMRQPKVLLLDEPSIGLAPRVVEELQKVVARLKSESLTIVITEQNIPWVLTLVDRIVVLESGQVTDRIHVDAAHPIRPDDILSKFLGGDPHAVVAATAKAKESSYE